MSLYQLVLPALALLSPSVAITSGPDFIGGINATTANLPYGSFLGSISDTYPLSLRFLGVPYATPPLYDLRFRAPVALDTNSSTSQFLNVTTYPEPCIQGTTGCRSFPYFLEEPVENPWTTAVRLLLQISRRCWRRRERRLFEGQYLHASKCDQHFKMYGADF